MISQLGNLSLLILASRWPRIAWIPLACGAAILAERSISYTVFVWDEQEEIDGLGAFLFPQFDYLCNQYGLGLGSHDAMRLSMLSTAIFLAGSGWLILSLLQRPATHFCRKHRRARGLCTTCAYDLTGITTGTCPECGSPVGRASSPSPVGSSC